MNAQRLPFVATATLVLGLLSARSLSADQSIVIIAAPSSAIHRNHESTRALDLHSVTNPAPITAIPPPSVPPPAPAPPSDCWEISIPFLLAAFIAACLFFPAAAPILGRILAALVNRVPALAGLAGVVSVEAFDAIVTAIERSKEQVRLGNDSTYASRGPAIPLHGALRDHLSRELDASHKRLVAARKRALTENATI